MLLGKNHRFAGIAFSKNFNKIMPQSVPMGKYLIAHLFAVSTKNIKLPGVLRQFDAISLFPVKQFAGAPPVIGVPPLSAAQAPRPSDRSYPQAGTERYDEILHVCDNAFRGKAAPVAELIGGKFRDTIKTMNPFEPSPNV
ncbi:MAG: hypothetical protein IKD59_00250 [Lachnospiraceae bacterium]|nr:hypothetical protein [Lachnospiraceae bacterium]